MAERDEIVRYIRQKIAEMLENETLGEMDVHEKIRDAGMDSLKVVQLIVHIEERFEVAFGDEELVIDYFATIDQFAENVAAKRAGLAKQA